MSWPDRLKMARNFYGDSQEEMAARLGVPYRTFQGYEAGASEPKAKILERLVELGFSGQWILSGAGPMRPGVSETAPPVPGSGPVAIDADLVGRVLEEISLIYKEFGWGRSLAQLGSEAAQIAADLATEGQTPEEKGAAVKAAGAMLRRQLRQALADPTGDAASKRPA